MDLILQSSLLTLNILSTECNISILCFVSDFEHASKWWIATSWKLILLANTKDI